MQNLRTVFCQMHNLQWWLLAFSRLKMFEHSKNKRKCWTQFVIWTISHFFKTNQKRLDRSDGRRTPKRAETVHYHRSEIRLCDLELLPGHSWRQSATRNFRIVAKKHYEDSIDWRYRANCNQETLTCRWNKGEKIIRNCHWKRINQKINQQPCYHFRHLYPISRHHSCDCGVCCQENIVKAE